ncbi:ATPase family protein associated with various cellular activities (AAA) [Mucilaginibacter frigoritolerans]|uniref:ATPase family protein associated with various cellular activities (AAA) n=1 Tax=Mucilaginibacter frigoritolerans TaxID=652788 RepID=A0A562UBY6_9SPHI|nr:restriction endonuclease [Mucilaginibacter frigoritolerans]TWJ03302.1 ATPase family protein associated with various cellular activities (AAA) [Mucilaginibacter frigoritolerans]
MADYDFSTLNSTDFEELVCDLLNAENQKLNNGIVYKTYPEGRDRGIDFRYSKRNRPNYIIGQVKHYRKSDAAKLIRDLKKSEKDKVVKLAPKRYIFLTSLELTLGEIDKIYDIFSPYIQSLSDIHDRKSLNRMLLDNSHIVDRHFKLWYSNTDVLKRILHFEQIGRSLEFTEDYLKKKLNLYVETSDLVEARKTLIKNKFIIITGDPGTGKTTLAELLVYEYIKDGYSLTYIHDDIRDIEKLLTPSDQKQIFYFDDFLGHNAIEIEKAKGAESALIAILKRIIRQENKLVVLTTRNFILTGAVEQSQKLKDFNIGKYTALINLSSYRESVKAQMLTNHAEYAELDEELKRVLSEHKIKKFIVSHKNFSPRSLEYITMIDKVADLSPIQFKNFIIENFTNPDEIWRMAYLQQIDEFQRLIINTMYSLGDDVAVEVLEKAFDHRLSYEVKHNNFVKPMFIYRSAFKKLYGSFIVRSNFGEQREYFKFNNPSLVDFLNNFILSNQDEIQRITFSAKYAIQLTKRFYKLYDEPKQLEMPSILKDRLLNLDFEIENYQDYDHLIIFFLLIRYVGTKDAMDKACDLLKNIEDYAEVFEDSFILSQFKSFIGEVDNPKLIEALNDIGMELFEPMLDDEYDLEEIIKTCQVIERKFSIKPELLLSGTVISTRGRIREIFFNDLEMDLDDLKRDIIFENELEEVQDKYLSYAKALTYYGIWIPSFDSYFDYQDWIEIISTNQYRYARDSDKT